MGQCAYLIIRTATKEAELFESNNFLPFFWLTLLDQSALAQAAPMWQYASNIWQADNEEQESFTDIWPSPTNLLIEKPALLANSANAHYLLQKSLPELMPAYEEFTSYLLEQLPEADDHIHLDIFALTALTSPAELLQVLRQQLVAIEQQCLEELPSLNKVGRDVVQLTGFPTTELGPSYPQLQTLRNSLRHAPRVAKLSADAKAKAKNLWLLVAGILLLYVSFRGYQHEGFTWLVASLALLGGVLAAWKATRLIGLWRNR